MVRSIRRWIVCCCVLPGLSLAHELRRTTKTGHGPLDQEPEDQPILFKTHAIIFQHSSLAPQPTLAPSPQPTPAPTPKPTPAPTPQPTLASSPMLVVEPAPPSCIPVGDECSINDVTRCCGDSSGVTCATGHCLYTLRKIRPQSHTMDRLQPPGYTYRPRGQTGIPTRRQRALLRQQQQQQEGSRGRATAAKQHAPTTEGQAQGRRRRRRQVLNGTKRRI